MVCFSCLPGAVYDLVIFTLFIGSLLFVLGLIYIVYKFIRCRQQRRGSEDSLDPQPDDALLV